MKTSVLLKKQVAFILCYCCLNLIFAQKNYSVSKSGNDANSGTSKNSAWKTINLINNHSFKFGDVINFRKDDVFYGSIDIKDKKDYLKWEITPVFSNRKVKILDDSKEESIIIYPNPATDILNFKRNIIKEKFSIYSTPDCKVKELILEQPNISINNLFSEFYKISIKGVISKLIVL